MTKNMTTIKTTDTADEYSTDVSEQAVERIISQQFTDSKGFIILMSLLVIAILYSSIATATQIQHYRQDYGKLQQMKQDYLKLQVEHRRLLLEQQTFSTTQQIAHRAVSELNMYFPAATNKLILQPTTGRPKSKQPIANDKGAP